jgi:hypothetical protein
LDRLTWVDWMREASAWDILLPWPDMVMVDCEVVWLIG